MRKAKKERKRKKGRNPHSRRKEEGKVFPILVKGKKACLFPPARRNERMKKKKRSEKRPLFS